MKIRQAKKIVRRVVNAGGEQEAGISYKTFWAAQKRFNKLSREDKQAYLNSLKENK